ncbi:MAG: hypothetical protein WA892_01620 [Ornithinimicrobium sp.]
MTGLWSTLIPLIVGSALVPVQVLITVLLLRSTAGRRTAVGVVGRVDDGPSRLAGSWKASGPG